MHSILIFILLIVSAWGYGVWLARLLWRTCHERFLFHLISFALGLGALGHLALLVGSFFPFNSTTLMGLMIAGDGLAAVALWRYRNVFFIFRAQIKGFKARIKWLDLTLAVFLGILIIFPLFRNSFVPPTNYDELAYHLAIPKIYLEKQSISYIPYIVQSNWPLETELLYGFGLSANAEKAAPLLTWVDFFVICLALIWFGKRLLSLRTGLLAALVFAGTPMVSSIAGTTLVEIPLTMYVFLSAIALFEYIQNRDEAGWIISAVLCGLAASTKLNAAVVVVIFDLLLGLSGLIRKEAARSLITRMAIFGLTALLVVSPWYLKSWIQTGSPFYTYLLTIFPARNWDAFGSQMIMEFILKPNLPLTPLNVFYLFWLMSVDYGKIGPVTFRLGATILAGLPFAFWAVWRAQIDIKRIVRWLLLTLGILYISFFFQTHQARFFMPAVPLLALAISIGILSLEFRLPQSLRWVGVGVFMVIIAANSWIFQPDELRKAQDGWLVLTHQMSSDSYLEKNLSGYTVYSFANQNLTANSKVALALWESRGYYLDRDYLWLNPIGQRDILLETMKSPTDLANVLKQRGITEILYNPPFTKAFTYLQYGQHYADLIEGVLAQDCTLLYRSGDLELYEFHP